MTSKLYTLYSNCQVVTGKYRSAIYDLQKESIIFIPNSSLGILKRKFFTHNQFVKLKQLGNELLRHNVLNVLKEKTTILEFPAIDFSYTIPSHFTNCLLIHSESINYKTLIKKLNDTNCKDIQIIFLCKIKLQALKRILSFFNLSIIKNIQLVFSEECITKKEAILLAKLYKRILAMLFYNCGSSKIIQNNQCKYIYSAEPLNVFNKTSKITTSSFGINIKLFSESLSFNTYYNKKLIINKDGDIVRSLYENRTFGKINRVNLNKLIESKVYRRYWEVKKDLIEDCRNCELRHCCIDDRKLIKTKNHQWKALVPCNYYSRNLKKDKGT